MLDKLYIAFHFIYLSGTATAIDKRVAYHQAHFFVSSLDIIKRKLNGNSKIKTNI